MLNVTLTSIILDFLDNYWVWEIVLAFCIAIGIFVHLHPVTWLCLGAGLGARIVDRSGF